MARTGTGIDDGDLRALFDLIDSGATEKVRREVKAEPELARRALDQGATRASWSSYRLARSGHGVYAGDTALHVAAAAYQVAIAELLLERGADVGARNRRDAQPLHYAVDGIPGSARWKPDEQAAMVRCLLKAGADPDAATKEGTTPLHRAVRNRCTSAVKALLDAGADWRRRNKNGSTSLHLAVQTTGRGGTGLEEARQQQELILGLLLKHGARLTDRDAKGKTVQDSITSGWVREFLER